MTALKAFGRLLWSPVLTSENWAQTLVRVAGNLLRWVIGLPIVVGLLGWGVFSFHSWWSDRPYRLTGLEGVELGMTPTEVTLIKGAPQYITPTLPEVTMFGPIIVVDPDGQRFEFPKGTSLDVVINAARDPYASIASRVAESPEGQDFLFPGGTPDEVINAVIREHDQGAAAIDEMRFKHPLDAIEVHFDRGSEGASQVSLICLTEPQRFHRVVGVSGSDTEAEVIRHLGQPDSVEIDDNGLSKWSSFERYNLVVRFEKARVVGICVGT